MSKRIADLLFPNIDKTPEFYENKYPAREGAGRVTRFAPSPTGFLHIGGLYTSLINRLIAKQSGGAFYLRIEDTDQKRLVENGVVDIITALKQFEVEFDEGPYDEVNEHGAYAPYRQSLRKEIYQAYAKQLVTDGKAYPCFCTEEDLQNIRAEQEKDGSGTLGYCGKWARCRDLTDEQIEAELSAGKPFVVRLRSEGEAGKMREFADGIHGAVSMPENILDIVITKQDGLPTYHFAHAIDDHLMHSTDIIRADEWLSSLPIHVQLFEMLGFNVPNYYHLSPIMKLDGTSRRKLSKRKDPEARVSFYRETGYPVKAVIDYLLTICSAKFEPWRAENPSADSLDFTLDLADTGVSGAMFDFDKLDNIAKNVIGAMTDDEIFAAVLAWATEFAPDFAAFINSDKDYFMRSIPIWHEKRLDIKKWSEVAQLYPYMYSKQYDTSACEMPERMADRKADAKEILEMYLASYDPAADSDAWFANVKSIAEQKGYCIKMGQYKKNPDAFPGSVADVSMFLRVAITGQANTPDLYKIIKLIGDEEAEKRIKNYIEKIK